MSGVKSLGDLLATFALAGSTAWIGASVAGFTALLAVVGAINQNLKELDQNTSNAFQTWSQSNDSFETQIDQINKLKASLESGTLSEQETQVFQTVQRTDADTTLPKDHLHHEFRIHMQIARAAVILRSSPFFRICQ